MEIKQGDVFWLDLRPPVGSEPGYRRPCVVVQNDILNASRLQTVLVCPLTGNVQRALFSANVLLEEGEAGLREQSVVITSQIATVDKADCQEYIGRLPNRRIREVIDGIRLVIEP